MTAGARPTAFHFLAAATVIAAIGVAWRLLMPGLPWFWWKYGGDILWGAMVLMLVAACRPRRGNVWATAAIAAVIAFGVELFRLYHAPALDAFRLTLAGKLLLGRVFSLWNMVAYWIGIVFAMPLLRLLSQPRHLAMTEKVEVSGRGAGRAAQWSTRLAFFVAGFGMAAWAPLVPFVKARCGLGESLLGVLLLCLGTGSILAMPVAGALARRFGCRAVVIATVGLICLALPVLATASSLALLVPALFVFGAGLGSVDCVVNIQAVVVERAAGRPLMSGFHGWFSVGGIAAAAGVSALLSLGCSPLVAALAVVVCIVLVMLRAGPDLLPYAGEGAGSSLAVPHGIVLFIGVLCFTVFLAEGSVLDWSAVFLTAERHVEPARAGLAYAGFAAAMTLGRFAGDGVVHRLGGRRVVIAGGLCAATGLGVATLVASWQAAILGYALLGLGCSNIVPVLYTAVGRQDVMPEHAAVPAITTLGYAGILAGPALIGFLAGVTSLPLALLAVAVLLLGVAASGRVIRI